MEFSRSSRFSSVLTDSIKLLRRNGKAVALVAFLSWFLNACLVLLFSYSVQPLVLGMAAATRQSTGRSSFTPRKVYDLVQMSRLLHHLRKDAALVFTVEVAFILAFSTISFFSIISTILISAKSLSSTELLSIIWRSWRGPLITNLYASALPTAYLVAVFVFAAPLWIYPDLPIFWLGILIGTPSFIFYLYLSVPWKLSMVVAVVEESCYGVEAVGRAAALVKGKRVQGFLVNVIYGVVGLMALEHFRFKMRNPRIGLIVLMSVSCLGKILMFVAYTVLYFHCKMHHGEDIAAPNYTKLSAAMDLGLS